MTKVFLLPGSCSGKSWFWPGKWVELIWRGEMGMSAWPWHIWNYYRKKEKKKEQIGQRWSYCDLLQIPPNKHIFTYTKSFTPTFLTLANLKHLNDYICAPQHLALSRGGKKRKNIIHHLSSWLINGDQRESSLCCWETWRRSRSLFSFPPSKATEYRANCLVCTSSALSFT